MCFRRRGMGKECVGYIGSFEGIPEIQSCRRGKRG
jgi:hypothetical protein